MPRLVAFLFGFLSMGFVASGLFFLRFWALTRDRLFLLLAIAFAVFAVERAAALETFDISGGSLWPYVLRIIGFAIVIAALIDKNRVRRL